MEGMMNLHQLCLMKSFLLCSLALLLIQGAPIATDMEHDGPQTDVVFATDMKCEIRSSCSSSPRCQYTKPMTVDPGSNITLNCAIITGGLVQGMTWEQAKQAIQNSTGSSDLILQQSGLTNHGKYSCRCAAINFTRALQIVWVSSSPNFIIEGRPKDLECFFSGWPLPREVYWYKDGELITNGTEGIYYSEDKKWKNDEETFHSKLHLPPGREQQKGFYKCSATNSIPGWSSGDSFAIQMLYECPVAKGTNADSRVIPASTSSNVNLSCWIEFDWNCPEYLFWYLNDNPTPLPESGDKYKVEVKDTYTECKKEFILSIFNVTENDEGKYSCQWECEYENTTKAVIELKVVDDLQRGI